MIPAHTHTHANTHKTTDHTQPLQSSVPTDRRQLLLFTLEMNETDRCSTCLNSSPNTQTGGVYVSVVVCVCACVQGMCACVCTCVVVACMFQRSSGRWHHFIVCCCSHPSRLPSSSSFFLISSPLSFLPALLPLFFSLKKCKP